MRFAALAIGALLLAACANPGFEFEELPDAPVAFFYRDREAATRRAEMIERAKEKKPVQRPGEARLRLEDLGDYLGLGPQGQERVRLLLGHIALITPTDREPRVLDVGLRGSRPVAWSPDHKRLLFTSVRRQGTPQLYEYDVESGDVRPLTHGPNQHPSASYGPDGRFAFCRVQRRGPEVDARIFVTRPGGGSPRPLSPGPHDCKPVWSPDGKWIVYQTRGPRGEDLIARMSPEVEAPPQIIARGRDPAFSPDGSWVVYSGKTRKGRRIRRMRPDGSGKLPIGLGIADEHDPVFSPDGRYVLFVVEERSRERLVVRSVDGGGERILFDDGGGAFPAW